MYIRFETITRDRHVGVLGEGMLGRKLEECRMNCFYLLSTVSYAMYVCGSIM